MEKVMTNNNSFITPLITAILAIIISGFFIGRVGTQDQIGQVDTPLSLYPNIETIRVTLNGVNLPKTAELMYRQSGETNWHTGHSLVRIPDGRLVGSLFGLSPATSYEVKVLNGMTEVSASIMTQPNELPITPSSILHVNDDAPAGGDGSVDAPFNKIQDAVKHAGPGTQVLVADGIYREAVTFPASGTPGKWIQVKAQGEAAILDSADYLSGDIWKPDTTENVWSTVLSLPVYYLARDGNR